MLMDDHAASYAQVSQLAVKSGVTIPTLEKHRQAAEKCAKPVGRT